MTSDERAALETLIAPVLYENGLIVFELTINHHRGVADIELLVDFPHGGVRLEDCARANHMIVAAIDESGIYGDDYTVSVCSPGLDRPLKTSQDFQRVAGSEVDVYYRDQQNGRDCCVQGAVESVDKNQVVVRQKTGTEVGILLEYIQKAYVKI